MFKKIIISCLVVVIIWILGFYLFDSTKTINVLLTIAMFFG